MVVLVRCCDDTCSLALKSRLDKLIKAGLVTAVLHEGVWVKTGHSTATRDPAPPRRPKNRVTALVTSF